MRTGLAGLLALTVSACAFATTRGPADPSGHTRPSCTTTTDPSKVDIGVGTASGLVGITSGLFIADRDETIGYGVLIAGIAALAGFYTSATVGMVRAKRCENAVSEYNFHAPDPVPTESDATDN